MTLFAQGDAVKLNPAVLQDETLKPNHHVLSRMLREDRQGTVTEQDFQRSHPSSFYYWVKFPFFTIRLSEAHLQLAFS
jgi:hypothetical protein